MHISKKFTACLWHAWKHTLLAPSLPLMLVINSWLCVTHNYCSPLLFTGVYSMNNKLYTLVQKAQPSTQSMHELHPLRNIEAAGLICEQPFKSSCDQTLLWSIEWTSSLTWLLAIPSQYRSRGQSWLEQSSFQVKDLIRIHHIIVAYSNSLSWLLGCSY